MNGKQALPKKSEQMEQKQNQSYNTKKMLLSKENITDCERSPCRKEGDVNREQDSFIPWE